MLIDALLTWAWTMFGPLIMRIPEISINDGSAAASALQAVQAAMYFFPMPTVTAIFSLILALWIFRVVISFLRAFWSILPFV